LLRILSAVVVMMAVAALGFVFAEDVQPPLAQQPVLRLRNQPGTVCEVKLKPGPDFLCEGPSKDAFTCRGIAVTYNPDCLEIHIVTK
jgi:hypothetical protein